MTCDLPGRCAGCGAAVVLRLGKDAPADLDRAEVRGTRAVREVRLPVGWCDDETLLPHRCAS